MRKTTNGEQSVPSTVVHMMSKSDGFNISATGGQYTSNACKFWLFDVKIVNTTIANVIVCKVDKQTFQIRILTMFGIEMIFSPPVIMFDMDVPFTEERLKDIVPKLVVAKFIANCEPSDLPDGDDIKVNNVQYLDTYRLKQLPDGTFHFEFIDFAVENGDVNDVKNGDIRVLDYNAINNIIKTAEKVKGGINTRSYFVHLYPHNAESKYAGYMASFVQIWIDLDHARAANTFVFKQNLPNNESKIYTVCIKIHKSKIS